LRPFSSLFIAFYYGKDSFAVTWKEKEGGAMLDVDGVILPDVSCPPQLIGRAVSADIEGI
jgi:hypothetical protein